MLALPAILFMLIIQGVALYQLFSPFYLWPPKITLPEELNEPEEPLEYEVNLDPGPMGPTPVAKPAESMPKPVENTPAVLTQSAAKSEPVAATAHAAPSNPVKASPVQASVVQASVVQASPAQASPAQTAADVVSISHSTPAPQPLLALEATPAPSAPDIVLVPSLDTAAASTTELPAEERGAPNGAPANSDAVSTPVRPLALEANTAPDRLAAAPISILPGVQALNIEPVIAANPVATADRAIDRVPVDLTVAEEKPVLSQIAVPAPAVDVTRPMRVPPAIPKPDLRVEQAKPNVAKPFVPAAAMRPVLSRADVSANPSNATPADLRVDADVATPNIATPSAPAAAVRPVLTSAPAKVGAAESVRLEVAVEELARPTMVVQAPIAATDGNESDSPKDLAVDRSAVSSDEHQSSPLDARNSGAPNSDAANSDAASSGTPDSDASTAQNSATPAQSNGANGLPVDPFARAGSGRGPRDLLGQGIDAAAAQVGANSTDSYQHGNAFRRYSDPFADDAPNPLASLRLREPQLFNDVLKFLVHSFGAVGNGGPGHDFSGPNGGVLIEQWIQQHHSDLQRECRVQQETMDEHIRRLLCGEP